MIKFILDGKRIPAADDGLDVLEVLEEEILNSCPQCKIGNASSCETTLNKLKPQDYDMVILDIF